MRLLLITLTFFVSIPLTAADTLSVFTRKIEGEDITYFSPLRQFADKALLTRCFGNMAISWEAPAYSGSESRVTYEFLIGHSTGTSKGDRRFIFMLNTFPVGNLTTTPGRKDLLPSKGKGHDGCEITFKPLEYDVNGDLFGFLFVTVPASMARDRAEWTVLGHKHESRDWLMVFNYSRSLKTIEEPTALVLRENNRRQFNLQVDYPLSFSGNLRVVSKHWQAEQKVKQGYNRFSFASYPSEFSGNDSLLLIFNERDTLRRLVHILPVKPYAFHLIHHSHNDIGYSHLQQEVAVIQANNIRLALRHTAKHCDSDTLIWHVESLWAVEQFLRGASKQEEQAFIEAVTSGRIVLSANYANVMSGLCQPQEHAWVLDYAKELERRYGFSIRNAMITDVPGINRSALSSYVDAGIPYLSLGPNYVETQPDKGDRVGSLVREQGDRAFYWKPEEDSDKKLLVWTAGKGYSYFHNITDAARSGAWEERLSRYCDELLQKDYPYDIVQLRYTKHADNGPVDTGLCAFVAQWNKRYSSPRLVISDVNTLFGELESRFGHLIETHTGEISPYWEDGAWSTAAEESENRLMAMKTVAMESFAKSSNQYNSHEQDFAALHRQIVLFHEHTWGAWCSISDPELTFTTEQWRIKRSFLDSARTMYADLAALLNFHYAAPRQNNKSRHRITDFTLDLAHGGLSSVMDDGREHLDSAVPAGLFELTYAAGIDPTTVHRPSNVRVIADENTNKVKRMVVGYSLAGIDSVEIAYVLNKSIGELICKARFYKLEVRSKESLHMAFPFTLAGARLLYGGEAGMVEFNRDQLPGSNKDFVNAEERLELTDGHRKLTITSPAFNLFEVGSIVDESRTAGAKRWKTEQRTVLPLYLYILNNYWHTNFKAWQSGWMEVEVGVSSD